MNCLQLLIKEGYRLQGYSPDTIILLAEKETDDIEECKSLLAYLEAVYG